MSPPVVELDPGAGAVARTDRRTRRSVRVAFAAAIVLGVAMPIFAGVVTKPVQSVRISGEFAQVARADIERVVQPLLAPGLVRIDLEALRRAALGLAWVRDVTVRRAWPDSLEIAVVERIALARWAGGGFLERDGTHFHPVEDAGPDSLPVLEGPDGAERRVLDLHIALERELAPLGMPLVATRLTERGVLHASLRHGPHFVMRPAALDRDLGLYAKTLANVMAGRLHEIARVDLRYPSGFAVRKRTAAAAGGGRG